jgi:hypothetical protein
MCVPAVCRASCSRMTGRPACLASRLKVSVNRDGDTAAPASSVMTRPSSGDVGRADAERAAGAGPGAWASRRGRWRLTAPGRATWRAAAARSAGGRARSMSTSGEAASRYHSRRSPSRSGWPASSGAAWASVVDPAPEPGPGEASRA